MKVPFLIALGAAGLLAAQSPQARTFEVASVRAAGEKPPHTPIAAAGEITGGPGTADPTRMTFTWVLMRRLLMSAFNLPLDQISGPDYVMGQDLRFDVVATVPEGATKEEAAGMLLNLLKERFHLTYHHETKDFDMYTLVLAKGGPKLKDAEVPDGPPPPAPQIGTPLRAAPQDRDGFPDLPAGRPNSQGQTRNGVSRFTFRMASTQMLLNMIQFSLGPSRTTDKTGLTGKYDFHLEFSQAGLPGPGGRVAAGPDLDSSDPAPDLFNAVEKQLGLKLEKSKAPLDVIVVDRMDKQPTDN